MRLRNIPGAREEIQENPYCIQNPALWKGLWSEKFKNVHPIHIEIGMGKGNFLTSLALLHPEINYIGIEKYSSVLCRAFKKIEDAPLPNLYFIRMDAENIEDVFAPLEISRIYLNFSDPWPKERHKKRRLTSPLFLARYDKILTNDGRLEFKTDNADLFSYSLEQINKAGWALKACTFDLHHDAAMNEDNIMTEYEERFSSEGSPIHKLIACRIK